MMGMTLKGDGAGIEAIAYECPNPQCRWQRRYTPKYGWLNAVIEHPGYGTVSGRDLVELDVKNHVCNEHIVIRAMMRKMRSQ